MGKYRKILVAIDGSESGKNVLRQAFKLADTEKSWLAVVSVAPSYAGDLSLVGVRNIEEVISGPYKKFLAEAKEMAEADGRFIRTACEQGEPYERIVDLAEAENCDLIMMGRKGATRLEKMLMGSVTARVIGYSQRDVLVVPQDESIGWNKILAPTDGSRFSEKAVERAIDFAKSYGGVLELVSVAPLTEELYAQAPNVAEDLIKKARTFAEEAKAKAEAGGIVAKTYVAEGDPYEVITKLAGEHHSDVVIMGSHGKTGLKRLLMGSVAGKTIGHSPCPVLVVK